MAASPELYRVLVLLGLQSIAVDRVSRQIQGDHYERQNGKDLLVAIGAGSRVAR
jgi:hypothetical protein